MRDAGLERAIDAAGGVAELARKIDQDAVMRAASVEENLAALLRCIGLLSPDD